MSAPHFIERFDTDGFQEWLEANGGELRAPTNEWEVLRYRKDRVIHVIYKNKKGALNYQGKSRDHYKAFLGSDDLAVADPINRVDTVGHIRRKKIVRQLVERDGKLCWFCGEFFGVERQKDRLSVEHLLPRSKGGNNGLANLVLAHAGTAFLPSMRSCRHGKASDYDRPGEDRRSAAG